MAKCIKDIEGKITRVSDGLAFEKVKAGGYTYCSKSDWKKAVRVKE
jgi:hypothetical protein